MLRAMFDILVVELGRAGCALSLQWCVLEPIPTLDELAGGASTESDVPVPL